MRLSLKRTTTLIIFSVFGILIFLIYISSTHTILPRFEKIERQMVLNNLKYAQHLIAEKTETIAMLTRDWAWWNDSYDFAQNQNDTYIETNLSLSTFKSTGVNFITFFDTKGQIIWGGYNAPDSETLTPLPWRFEDFIFKRIASWGKSYRGSGFKGIANIEGNVMLVGCEMILTTAKGGPPKGWLLMGSVLTPETFKVWAMESGLNIEAQPIDESALIDISDYPKVDIKSGSVSAEDVLTGMDTRPQLLLKTSLPSEVSSLGQNLVLVNSACMTLACLLMAGLTFFLLQTKILKRISSLAQQVKTVAQTPNEAYDIAIPGRDEITGLAQDVNGMVQHIKEEKRFLNNMMDSLQIGIFLISVENHIIVEANPYACTLVGLPHSDVIGSKYDGFICSEEDTACVDTGLEQAVEHSSHTLLHADGQRIKVLKSVVPITRDNTHFLLQSFIDISELEATQNALEKSEIRYQTIFNNTGTASIISNADTTIAMANSEFYRISGYTEQQIQTGLRWTQCFHPDDTKWMLEYHQLRRTENADTPRTYEARFITNTGEQLTVELTVSMFPGTSMSIASLLDITAYKKREEKLTQQTFYDSSTQLPNKQLFMECLSHSLKNAQRSGRIVALLYIALNEEVTTHDLEPNPAKNRARKAARELQKAIGNNDTLAYIQKDTFILLVEGLESPEASFSPLDRVLNAFSQSSPPKKGDLSAHVGIALYPDDGRDPEELLRNASLAQKRIPLSTHGDFALYSEELTHKAIHHMGQLLAIKNALKDDLFLEYIYPWFTEEGNTMSGFSYEIHPAIFGKPESQENPLSSSCSNKEFARSIALHALKKASMLIQQVATTAQVSLEVVYATTKSELCGSGFAEDLYDTIQMAGLNTAQLIIALPAELIHTDFEMIRELCEKLHKNQIQIAITDFGAMIPSLESIQKIAPARLIINEDIVAMSTDQKDSGQQIAQGIITLGQSMAIPIMATGVKEEAQKQLLIKWGCQHVQGSHLAPQLTLDEFMILLAAEG